MNASYSRYSGQEDWVCNNWPCMAIRNRIHASQMQLLTKHHDSIRGHHGISKAGGRGCALLSGRTTEFVATAMLIGKTTWSMHEVEDETFQSHGLLWYFCCIHTKLNHRCLRLHGCIAPYGGSTGHNSASENCCIAAEDFRQAGNSRCAGCGRKWCWINDGMN